jgi:hypothetical protein
MIKYGKREDFFYDGTHYISKGAYYKGSSFLIYPTMEEVNRKLIIPGDRWHPFCPSSLHPWEIKLLHTQRVIPLKKINYPMKALRKYHQLLGRELYLLSLIEDLYEPNDSICMPVLDMSSFYDNNCFRVGDAIRIKVIDYHGGIYKPEYVSRTELINSQDEEAKWLSLMEKSMDRVIKLFKDRLILANQVDWAYFFGGQRLTHSPSANVHEFLERTDHFSIKGNEGVYFLVENVD